MQIVGASKKSTTKKKQRETEKTVKRAMRNCRLTFIYQFVIMHSKYNTSVLKQMSDNYKYQVRFVIVASE